MQHQLPTPLPGYQPSTGNAPHGSSPHPATGFPPASGPGNPFGAPAHPLPLGPGGPDGPDGPDGADGLTA